MKSQIYHRMFGYNLGLPPNPQLAALENGITYITWQLLIGVIIMSNPLPHSGHPCVVCNSPYVLKVFDTVCKTAQGDEVTTVYFCMLCESFSAPNAKPVLNGGSALSWHKTVHDRNVHWSEELLGNLSKVCVVPPHIIEIGCGIGTFLKIAKEHGIDGTGYDSDFEAVSYGRAQFGLDLKSELWTFDTAHIVDNSLLVSISMLEHIHFPRQLIKDMVAYMKLTSGNILFLCLLRIRLNGAIF